jgi:EAL domain-containing protein (putative c-di-GMP-specific phosphodiesterase class I)/ActR/RegA family two-component response regulator
MVPPVRFIPLAEEIGLIYEIGDWVMRTACQQHKVWRQDQVADVAVSVNVSAPQFLQDGFVAAVAAALRDTAIEPNRLELEITESLSMQDPEATMRLLHQIKAMGIKLSIDDFGTGYSNLSYLKRFPVNTVKLDQSFVREIVHNKDDLAISDAIISMAHSLRLSVTAEGVETEAQLALLADHRCDEIQGYYFGRPMPVPACTTFLRENPRFPLEKFGRRRTTRTLLLVDDDPRALEMMVRHLDRFGYHILKASSGLQALDLLATNEVGVILCDQQMPDMSGTEFFFQVRGMYPGTVRILLTAHSDIDAVTDAINLGAIYKYFSKPCDMRILGATLDEAFDRFEPNHRHAKTSLVS